MEKRLREKNMLICILVIVSIGEYAYAQLQPDTPLSMANASFIGMYPEASGWSVASAGDVNGDGYDDFLIGGLGKTYLILGRAASNWGTNYDLASSDASFISQVPGQQCGYSVASAGDVNGDGLDDFLIGAPFSNQTGVDSAGVTYLILGRAAANWGTNYDLASADASFIGEVNHDLSGWTVASAGDVDGDGFYDFLIGAHANQEGGPVVGQTYLILGRAAANWGTNFNLSGADASFIGEAVGDFSGWSVASAGDVDGDGYDDFLIGAFGNDDGGTAAGKTYLILGDVAAAGWVMDYDLALANASFIGEADDIAGYSVASAGDVNGDGYDDFLIGAHGSNDGGGAQAGEAYLILGRAAANWGTNFNLSGADASFIGEAVGDFSGWSVASAGDMNGDGYDDFLIGASRNDDGGTTAGKTYLILGDVAAAGWVMDYDLALANASFIGEGAGDQSSWSVASAGDVNGDGLDDFLIGAFANGGQAGKTYLLLGEVIVAVEDETGAFISPDNFSLSQNYPNPFNPTTTITYQLPKTSQVDISIYNLTGQLVKTLVSEHKNAGYHSTEWNSSGVGSGVYFYRIEAGEYTETKKCLILK